MLCRGVLAVGEFRSYAYKEQCDELCTIPMAEAANASSFNVSCAASIMMYEVVRQRGIGQK